jgi:predicted esterase YcpF (UPF0227 family)
MKLKDYLKEGKTLRVSIDHLSQSSQKAINDLEKAIEKNSYHLPEIIASTLQIVYNDGYETGLNGK